MTYENLAKTFAILAKYDPTGCVMDWAEHDEWGIDLSGFNLSSEDIRMLAELDWGLGSDYEQDDEEMAAWYNPAEHTDEEIVEVFNNYKSIYKYA